MSKGVMKNWKCECILTYKMGSLAIDALHDMSEDKQKALVDQYVSEYGQEYVDEIVKHIEADFSLSTDPDYNPTI